MFEWSASSPSAGIRSSAPRVGPAVEVVGRWQELRSLGSGYLEVSPADAAYPLLTLSFQAEQAVVHRFTAEDECDLLVGDGSVDPLSAVDVPYDDDPDPASFTGDWVSSVDRADELLQGFLSGTALADLGTWDRL